jgi:N-acetylglucosaminyl-diphospho-decaprenol L-rhamnosyltransferase
MSDVDVVVLDLDGGAMTADCLASIDRQALAPANVIVFDNGSQNPSPRATHRSATNLGFAAGVNAAVTHSTAPFVAVVNNDVVLDPDWLATVRGAMREGVAAVQTILRRDDDTDTIDGAGIDVSDGTIRQIGHRLPLGTPLPPAWGVSATATLYRRELLHFDESFFAYYEDVELSARLREGGWQLIVLTVAKATHRGSQSAARLGPRARFLRTRNRYRIARMHRGVGRVGALLFEDLRLLVRGRSSVWGIVAGLFGRVSSRA